MSGLLPVAEALKRVLALVEPTGTETVPLAQAGDRVLAGAVTARRSQPPFDASAMDGYAVRAAEARAGAVLAVAGEVAAGGLPRDRLAPGSAVRIFTGAPLPPGADAILIQENATRTGQSVRVESAPEPGAFIRPAGMDFPVGFRLEPPLALDPRHVALLAAMNAPRVTVARRPVVAIVPTGDELVEPGTEPGPAQIVTSNSYGLAAMVARAGGEPRLCSIARDTPESVRAAHAAARGADMMVTLGGASVGEHDIVARVLREEGLTLDLHRIAMRPGKPLMAGKIGRQTFLGLPGNPVSALVCGLLFVVPAVRRALGLPGDPPARRRATLIRDIPENGKREHYMRALLHESDEGLMCDPAPDQDSSLLRTLSHSNGLAVRPPFAHAASAGDAIDVIPLD